MLYFAVRTDVSKDDGLQRVFGCFDTIEEAEAFITANLSHLKGVFEVFGGKKIEA